MASLSEEGGNSLVGRAVSVLKIRGRTFYLAAAREMVLFGSWVEGIGLGWMMVRVFGRRGVPRALLANRIKKGDQQKTAIGSPRGSNQLCLCFSEIVLWIRDHKC